MFAIFQLIKRSGFKTQRPLDRFPRLADARPSIDISADVSMAHAIHRGERLRLVILPIRQISIKR